MRRHRRRLATLRRRPRDRPSARACVSRSDDHLGRRLQTCSAAGSSRGRTVDRGPCRSGSRLTSEPLSAPEHVAQNARAIGHDAVHAQVEKAVHLAVARRRSTHGPGHRGRAPRPRSRRVTSSDALVPHRDLETLVGGSRPRDPVRCRAPWTSGHDLRLISRGPAEVHTAEPSEARIRWSRSSEKAPMQTRSTASMRTSASTSGSTTASDLGSMLNRCSGNASQQLLEERDRFGSPQSGTAIPPAR